jgi:hypothetical protein
VAEGRNLFSLCQKGYRATKFFYEKQKKMYSTLVGAKNTASKVKSPKFIYGDSPSASCLLPS